MFGYELRLEVCFEQTNLPRYIFLLCLKWFNYLKLLQVLSNNAKLFLQIQDLFLTQSTSEKVKDKPCHVTVQVKCHKIYLSIMCNHRSQKLPIITPFKFTLHSCQFPCYVLIFPLGLSHSKLVLFQLTLKFITWENWDKRLLSFRKKGKITWRC